MKRGFLNGSKAKARPLGPALASKRCPVLLDFTEKVPKVIGDRERYHGVFLNLSRVNHSCSPNTTYRFDLPSFSYRLFAVRDIVEGTHSSIVAKPNARRDWPFRTASSAHAHRV
ncbi:hypothetical protein C8R46DRAFT_507825 [Mycena filopes]|nr:hypothetical protein C8R46DRAFT_507825 [Mycena filopes]